MNKNRVIIAVSGASGAVYTLRLIRFLMLKGYPVDLIASDYGKYILAEETQFYLEKESFEDYFIREYGDRGFKSSVTIHKNENLASALASGRPDLRGMVVVPCTMKTLSGIANGYSSKLIERAADCVLKERQKLILVPRETPLSLIHIKNMEKVTLAGGIIVPAMPAFYQKPKDFNDLGDFIAARILNLLDIENDLYPRWREES